MTEWNPIDYLNSQHTRQLMQLRDLAYKFGHNQVNLIDYPPFNPVTSDQIKLVLDTREHIPNKKEAKELRRQRAKLKY